MGFTVHLHLHQLVLVAPVAGGVLPGEGDGEVARVLRPGPPQPQGAQVPSRVTRHFGAQPTLLWVSPLLFYAFFVGLPFTSFASFLSFLSSLLFMHLIVTQLFWMTIAASPCLVPTGVQEPAPPPSSPLGSDGDG